MAKMVGKVYCFFCCLFGLLCCSSQLSAQHLMTNVDGLKTTSLNGKWHVITDCYNRGTNMRIFEDRKATKPTEFVEYSFGNAKLQLPGDWNSLDPSLRLYEGTVWYKKEVTIRPQKDKHWFIYFGAANYETQVYLNGKKLGSHEGGFTPFQLEITDVAKAGINTLVVAVNNQRKIDAIPAMNYDWWNFGGITRDVFLIETPLTFAEDYFIQLQKGNTQMVEGCVNLNGPKKEKEVTVQISAVVIVQHSKTDTAGFAKILCKAPPKLWSPADPFLHRVSIATNEDSIEEKIGFRDIAVKGEDVLLNGKPIFLKGVNFHEEIAQEKRRACSEADALQLLNAAKAFGCNFIRTSHYPQQEKLVKKAEAMGLLLWEEIPLWQGIQFNNPVILAKAENMLREMIERDKNHAGVIIWSISNETAPAPDKDRVLTNMAATCRKLDPTRLVASAFDHVRTEKNTTIVEDTLDSVLDVFGINRYMGWYKPWPDTPGTMTFQSAFHKPMIISEFGGEAKYGNHGTAESAGLWNEAYQEKLYKDNIAMFRNIPFLRGVSPWVQYDFRSPTRMNA